MRKAIPNWRKVSCPRCKVEPGHACFTEGDDFRMVHPERQRLAERQYGARLRGLGRAARNITPAMRYWSEACRNGHPEQCTGRRRSKAERGWKPCENPIHQVTTEMVT
jgi:hypothetical protein